MKADFRPPLDNSFIIRAAQLAARWVARLWRRVVAIEISEEDLGDAASWPIQSAIKKFPEDFKRHLLPLVAGAKEDAALSMV